MKGKLQKYRNLTVNVYVFRRIGIDSIPGTRVLNFPQLGDLMTVLHCRKQGSILQWADDRFIIDNTSMSNYMYDGFLVNAHWGVCIVIDHLRKFYILLSNILSSNMFICIYQQTLVVTYNVVTFLLKSQKIVNTAFFLELLKFTISHEVLLQLFVYECWDAVIWVKNTWTFRKAMSENLLKGGKPLCFHDNSVIGVGR